MPGTYTVVIQETNSLNGNKQPFQIDLFSSAANNNPKFSTLLTLYDLIPHYIALQDSSDIQNVPFKVGNELWELEIAPAIVSSKKKGANSKSSVDTLIRFSHKREELVMAGLKKLAAASPVMSDNQLGVPFYLRELQRVISNGPKTRYSLSEIKLSLSILKNTSYKLINRSEDKAKQEWEYTQITEIMSCSDMNENDTRYFVVFNRLLTQQILNLKTRLYNFDRYKEFHRSLSRTLYTRLCIRFVQASDITTYTIKVSTLRQSGGLGNPENMAIDKRRLPVVNAFKELVKFNVLSEYKLVKSIQMRSTSNNRKRTVDEEYIVIAASEFIAEQKKASAINTENIEKLERFESERLASTK